MTGESLPTNATHARGALALDVPPARVMLAIETSNPSAWEGDAAPLGGAGVALARGGPRGALTPLGVAWLDATRAHDDRLMPTIDELCRAHGVRPRDLTDVAVSIGPGGYTGLRIAVTTAKLLAEVTGARAIAVPSALVAARRADHSGHPFAVAISSKGETTFLTAFAPRPGAVDEVEAAGPGRLIGADELQSALAGADARLLVADRFLPASIRARAEALGVPIQRPRFDPLACAQAAASIEPVEPAALLPLYPREPEAVTRWRALHPR